jgi:hypothetical protein
MMSRISADCGVITDKARKHGLALELARLDKLKEVFLPRALDGDVRGALVTKIIERGWAQRFP